MANVDNSEKYVELSAAQKEYIRIYHHYFVLKWTQQELCDHFQCSNFKISTAIRWVINNKLNLPPEYLIEGAIDSISERLKKNKELLDIEYKKTKYKDKRFIIDLNKEIREDENQIYRLQCLLRPEESQEDSLKASDVLKLIKASSSQD
jgi:hypothetical protein